MNETVDGVALVRWLREFAHLIEQNADALTELDAAIGDADHGTNLRRGMRAVTAALDAEPGLIRGPVADVAKTVAMALISNVGGASGPLYGTFFLRFSAAASGDSLSAAEFGRALRAGLDGIVQRGKAATGDKTMVDAWLPACAAFDLAVESADDSALVLHRALTACATASAHGRDGTAALIARKGRASYLGERSVGHVDPGAASTALLLRAAADTLGQTDSHTDADRRGADQSEEAS